VILERTGTDRRKATWPATTIALQVRVALKQWLESVDASASADDFPTRPLVWRLRLSLKMSGHILDGLESQPR
jgi:hypothetical protein